MRTHDVISFMLLLAVTGFITGYNDQITTFRTMAAANGSTMCATSKPASSLSVTAVVGLKPGVPPIVGCAFLCTALNASGAGCSAVNCVNNGTIVTQCQFYKNQTSRCVVSSSECMFLGVNISALLNSQIIGYHFGVGQYPSQARFEDTRAFRA